MITLSYFYLLPLLLGFKKAKKNPIKHSTPSFFDQYRQSKTPLHRIKKKIFPLPGLGNPLVWRHHAEKKKFHTQVQAMAATFGSDQVSHIIQGLPLKNGEKEANLFLPWAIGTHSNKMIPFLLNNPSIDPNAAIFDKCTPLLFAIEEANIPAIHLFLSAVKINQLLTKQKKINLLIQAGKIGKPASIGALLDYLFFQVNQEDQNGDTLLIHLARYGHIDATELVINHPLVEINRGNKLGTTAFMAATEKGHVEILKLFLAHKDFLRYIRDNAGNTPFILACIAQNKASIIFLLTQNWVIFNSVNERKKSGWDYLFEAKEKNKATYKAIYKALLRHYDLLFYGYLRQNYNIKSSNQGVLLSYIPFQIGHPLKALLEKSPTEAIKKGKNKGVKGPHQGSVTLRNSF